MIEELRKIKTAEIEKEIAQLSSMTPETKKFNWLERKIIKVKEYKEEQNRVKKEAKAIKEKINKLIEKKDTYKYVDYIQGFDITLEEAIKLLQEKGISPVLNENDFSNTWKYEKPGVDNLEGLILVHKTDYAPIDSKIKSTKESKSYVDETHTIEGYQIPIRTYNSRNTVHFAVNGEVSSHFAGNWEDKKYAILIPFTDIPKEKYASVSPEDTYTIGGVNLTPNSWILVPKGEKEIVKKNNPNINVIEYEGQRVTKYADQLVKMLGYSIQSIDAHGWRDCEEHKKYTSNMIKHGFKLQTHSRSEQAYEERFETYMQTIVQTIQYVNENLELLKNNDFLTELTDFIKKYISLACQKSLNPKQTIVDIQKYLLSYSFYIPETNLSKFSEYCKGSTDISYYMTIEIMNALKNNTIENKEYNNKISK